MTQLIVLCGMFALFAAALAVIADRSAKAHRATVAELCAQNRHLSDVLAATSDYQIARMRAEREAPDAPVRPPPRPRSPVDELADVVIRNGVPRDNMT